MKISIKGIEAKKKAINGANYLADCVKSSLGPFGKVALLEKGNKFTNDGKTISSAVAPTLVDEYERRGALKFHEACDKANNEVEDGSTTTTTLAQSIMNEVDKLVGQSERLIVGNKTPADIKIQLEKESAEVIERLKEDIKQIESEEELINSAIVSTGDKMLGELIGKAQWKLGKDGVLIAEASLDKKCSVEFVDGIRIDNGYGTSIAINNDVKQALEVKDVPVIMTNYVFTEKEGIAPIKQILDGLGRNGTRDVIIIARAFSSNAILDCQTNSRNGFRMYPINAPYTDQNEIMKDMAAVLGGRYINSEDTAITDMQLSDVGFAKRVIAKRFNAVFTGMSDNLAKERIEKRLKELKDKLSGEISDFERKNLNARISQLSVGYGIIKVGDVSETEAKRLLDKAEDAVGAVRAAFQEGTVKGGGLAFKEISDKLPDSYLLKKPIKSIYEEIMATAPNGFVIEDWVRDPFKILRVALTVACSVAYQFANVGVMVVEENKPKIDLSKLNNIQEDE
jgi:chaperonin GroEL